MTANALDAIVLLGDSLTQGGWEAGGFAQKLAYVYARKLNVINSGLSGYNTEWAIPVVEQSFPKTNQPYFPKCKLLVVWFGANDACLLPSPQHVPLPKFKENLTRIVNFVKSQESEYHSPTTRVILMTPPPIDEARRGAELASRDPPIGNDREWNNSLNYGLAVKEVGKNLDVPVVDLWDAIWVAAGEEKAALAMFLSDGLHLTPQGYKIVYDELLKSIEANFPELHYDKLPQVFPHWSDIDWKNPSIISRRIDV